MSLNIFATRGARRALVTSTVGAALTAVAAAGALGPGTPGAGAAPMLAADPLPIPGPAGGVGAANGIFEMLNSLLDSVVPGAGSIMPSPTTLTPGGVSVPPGQNPAIPGQRPALPGQTPGLSGPAPAPPGQAGTHVPTGQTVA